MSPELLLVAFIVGSLVSLKVVELLQWLRARRNERQLQLELLQRRGFKAAERFGWLPDDTQ